MSRHGTIEEFDSATEDWRAYSERLEQYFVANDADDAAKKRAILLSVCGASTYNDSHSTPGQGKAARTVATFVSELKQLAVRCDFGASLEELLRDRLVCGIKNEHIQRHLLAEPHLTFTKAQDIALALESADRNTADLQQQVQAAVPVHALKKSQKAEKRSWKLSAQRIRMSYLWEKGTHFPRVPKQRKDCGNTKPPKGQNAKVVEAEEESFVINLSKVKWDQLYKVKGSHSKDSMDPAAHPQIFKPQPLPLALKTSCRKRVGEVAKRERNLTSQFSDWAAPVVPVVKGDDLYESVETSKLQSTKDKFLLNLNLANAYLQLMVEEKSKEYLTINTHKGLFSLLQGLKHVAVYLDDILITGQSEADHLRTLEDVLGRLEAAGMRLKAAKCLFMQKVKDKEWSWGTKAFEKAKELLTASMTHFDSRDCCHATHHLTVWEQLSHKTEDVMESDMLGQLHTILLQMERGANLQDCNEEISCIQSWRGIKNAERRRRDHDKTVKQRTFTVGDNVLVLNFGSGPKWLLGTVTNERTSFSPAAPVKDQCQAETVPANSETHKDIWYDTVPFGDGSLQSGRQAIPPVAAADTLLLLRHIQRMNNQSKELMGTMELGIPESKKRISHFS
eukprot:Em0643g2a